MDGLKAGQPILARMQAISDPLRCRFLLVLERNELTVGELCAIFQLPQSTVSRHLRVLADEGWITSRRDGTSRYYSMPVQRLSASVRRLWLLVRDEMHVMADATQDEQRLRDLLAARRSRSQDFFSSAAGQWDKLRDEYFGATFHLRAVAGLLDESSTIGDLGCGTGRMTEVVAPFVQRVIAVDAIEGMLSAARERLAGFSNVEIRQGSLEALPIEDQTLDAALVMLVLHHVPDPELALRELRRVVRPGGKVLIVDMLPHDREEYRQLMGHIWLGFSESHMRGSLSASGFELAAFYPLSTDPKAKGPGLFAATARRAESAIVELRHNDRDEMRTVTNAQFEDGRLGEASLPHTGRARSPNAS